MIFSLEEIASKELCLVPSDFVSFVCFCLTSSGFLAAPEYAL